MSKAKARLAPSFACTMTAQEGIGMSGEIVARMIASRSSARVPAMSRGAAGRCDGHVRGDFTLGGDPPCLDAGALYDPIVGSRDHFFKILIGQHTRRRISAGANDMRIGQIHRPSGRLDHDDFGLHQSKIMKRGRFKRFEWDGGAKALTLSLIPPRTALRRLGISRNGAFR